MPKTDPRIFEFLVPLAVREGAWVVIPKRPELSRELTELLRQEPCRIEHPPGNPYRFAERGAYGHWVLLWVPD